MKKLFLIILIACLCLPLFPSLTFAESLLVPKKIGVLELENKTSFPGIGSSAADAILSSLLQAKSSDVMEREHLNQTFIQNEVLRPKGIIDPAIVSSIGTKLGLDYILMGSIVSAQSSTTPAHWQRVKMGQMWTQQLVQGYSSSSAAFEVMMVDVKTAQIVWSGNYKGYSNSASILDALRDGGHETVRKIYKFIPLQGTITRIDNDKVYIDLGKANGIKPKDTFLLPDPTLPTTNIENKKPLKLKVSEVGDTYCITSLKDPKIILNVGATVSKSF